MLTLLLHKLSETYEHQDKTYSSWCLAYLLVGLLGVLISSFPQGSQDMLLYFEQTLDIIRWPKLLLASKNLSVFPYIFVILLNTDS